MHREFGGKQDRARLHDETDDHKRVRRGAPDPSVRSDCERRPCVQEQK